MEEGKVAVIEMLCAAQKKGHQRGKAGTTKHHFIEQCRRRRGGKKALFRLRGLCEREISMKWIYGRMNGIIREEI